MGIRLRHMCSAVAAGFLTSAPAWATDTESALMTGLDTVWVLLGAFLVFFMQAGLVAITAPCAYVGAPAAIVIGTLGGVIVTAGVVLLDKCKIDDPVGAFPVHGLNGIWGTLAVGLFGRQSMGLARDGLFCGGGFTQLGVQLIGSAAVGGVWSFLWGWFFLRSKKASDCAYHARKSFADLISGSTVWNPVPDSRFSPPSKKNPLQGDCMMKLIIAYIQPEKLNGVKKALYEAEVHKMSVTNALGCGQQMGFTESYRGVAFEVNLLKKIHIEVAVNEGYVDHTIQAIVTGARTGTIGDGKIFVLNLGECILIRTGERVQEAIV